MIDEVQSIRALERFARNAIELRGRAGLTRSEAALRAGLHDTGIGLLERAIRMPRLDTVLRVAGAVEADPAELLEGLTWDLERSRLREAGPVPGRYVSVVCRVPVRGAADGTKEGRAVTPAERFGVLLAGRRMWAALRQEDLARLVAIHRAEVSLLERGGRRPRLDTILQLAAAVECEPHEMLTGMRWVPGTAELRGGYLDAPRPAVGKDRHRSAGDPAPLLRQFGVNLRALREELGWTREELAGRAGIGSKLLVDLEDAGGTIPAHRTFLRLVGALGCRPYELVAGVEWVPYETCGGEGTFEVVEDARLLDEIAALREARAKGRPFDSR